MIVCFGQLMIMLDSTIVNVALPSIQRDLGFSQAELTWIVNAYLIAYGSFLLVAGRIGDLIGRKKVFLAGVILFTAASVASGVSHGAAELIATRFLQGLGGSLSAGVILAIIVTGFPRPAERAQAMSVFTFVIAGGGSLGLLAGGFLTQLVNWHWIFFINVPIGLVTFALGAWLVEEKPGLGLRHGVDVAGAVLITAALMLGVYAIVTAADNGWTSLHTIEFGGAAVILLAGFIGLESRLANPLMPLRIFRIRSLVGGSAVRAFLVAGMFTNFFMGALYLQHVKGFSAINTGLAFLPSTLMVGAMSLGIAARLMARLGPRTLAMFGLVSISLGLAGLAGVDAHAQYFPRILASYLLIGLGGGMSFLPLLTISMSEVPAADAGLASGFGNVMMQIGAAIGLAALGTLSTEHTQALIAQGYSLPSALTGGYQLAFLLAAISVAAALVLTLVALRTTGGSRRPEPARFELDEGRAEAEAA
ncbi:MAG TPA: MFS transporter [Candidatus Sulfotelmatobacter sp.]|nr:MFS transporter [Candidatus Sulfotelmatobacter sp.]